MIKRTASAVWSGTLKEGRGTMSSHSGVLSDAPYAFGTRFEDAIGTNPEELIGAAHAGCFSMALSKVMAEAGLEPQRIATTATVSMDKVDGGMAITGVHLETRVTSPGADAAAFQQAAQGAKAGCPVSQALAVEITLDAQLEA